MKNLSTIWREKENYEISVILCKIKQIKRHVVKMQQNYMLPKFMQSHMSTEVI